jgi:scyllo-inositol 2-dehydrogenase (NADP+)
MDQLKWGLIGSYDKVELFQSELPYANQQHILHSVLTVDHEAPRNNLEGVEIYTDMYQFMQADCDAVYIASPYGMHYAQVKQCLLNHKAVLCERPIAQNAEELIHLMHLSQHNHTFMMEAMWIRFMPSIKKILSIISSGAIGEIVSVKASVNYKNGPEKTLSSGGGALFELGIYPVFLCTLFLGRPDFLQASGTVENDEDENFSAFLSYEGGQYGFIETNKKQRGQSYALITGDKGSIEIKNPWSAKPEGIEVDFFDGTKVLHKSQWEGIGLHFELDEVYDCLQQEVIESQYYCHHFSLDVMQTIDDIRKQLQS